MISTIKKYKVSIFGKSYSLVSDEPEERITAAAQLVNMLMREISSSKQLADSTDVAVLVALQLAGELKKLETYMEQKNQEQSKLIDLIDRELSVSVQ